MDTASDPAEVGEPVRAGPVAAASVGPAGRSRPRRPAHPGDAREAAATGVPHPPGSGGRGAAAVPAGGAAEETGTQGRALGPAPLPVGWALPDHLRPGLRLVVVGFNPGLRSAALGHYYAHPSNRLWDLLFEAGLLSRRLQCSQDSLAPALGVGFTDVVKRASASSSDLAPAELRAGAAALRERLLRCPPRVVCWGGKGVYRAFAGLSSGRRVSYGRQPEAVLPGVVDFVAPSPSGRSGLPYAEKLRWYRELARVVSEA